MAAGIGRTLCRAASCAALLPSCSGRGQHGNHGASTAAGPSALAGGLRRSHSAAGPLYQLSNFGSLSGHPSCGTLRTLSLRRSTVGNSAVFSGRRSCNLPRTRSVGVLVRACDASAADTCGTWDEDECKGLVSESFRRSDSATSAVPVSAQQLPPFEWDLPELKQQLPMPQSQQIQRLPPWGHNKQRKHAGQHGSFQSWSESAVPPGIDVLENLSVLSEMEEIYVILFGVGDDGDEGIYSLKSMSQQGVAVDTVIAFENEVDAERYAGLLEAVMVWTPSVHSITPVELVEFVLDSGLDCRLQLQGSNILPPDWNVPVGLTDWERNKRLKQGYFTVLEAEPDVEIQHTIELENNLPLLQLGDLEDIRQHLENLYSAS